jgi:RNA methyltransferase, TrmH family
MSATPPLIDSPRNARVSAARSLRSRKGRTAASAFLVEGPHAVAEALGAGGYQVRELFVTQVAAAREPDLVRAATVAGADVRSVTDHVLATLRDTVTPQGIIAVVSLPDVGLGTVLRRRPRLMTLLDGVGDPGNAGTVIRTADAVGADVVAVTAGSVDVWSGKCVRASAGSVFHVPIVTGCTVADAASGAAEAGCQVLATGTDGDADLDELIDQHVLAAPTVWIFGNEAHGISAAAREAAQRVVRVPVYGGAESLNLAAAAAICLYASARAQRR